MKSRGNDMLFNREYVLRQIGQTLRFWWRTKKRFENNRKSTAEHIYFLLRIIRSENLTKLNILVCKRWKVQHFVLMFPTLHMRTKLFLRFIVPIRTASNKFFGGSVFIVFEILWTTSSFKRVNVRFKRNCHKIFAY